MMSRHLFNRNDVTIYLVIAIPGLNSQSRDPISRLRNFNPGIWIRLTQWSLFWYPYSRLILCMRM